MTLKEYYEKHIHKEWIPKRYSLWRGQVVHRINKMYKENYKNLTDEEILRYLEMSRFYR